MALEITSAKLQLDLFTGLSVSKKTSDSLRWEIFQASSNIEAEYRLSFSESIAPPELGSEKRSIIEEREIMEVRGLPMSCPMR
jgi:hypothetical protein